MLFQSFNLHLIDVLKLGMLVDHMEFHEDTYGDDIFSFMAKHYGNEVQSHNEQNSGEEGDHQKLPFHQKVCLDGVHIIISGLTSKLDIADKAFVKETPFYYYNFYSFLETNEIFQPPKAA